jgi:8-oxo-dGTP diphosphatase
MDRPGVGVGILIRRGNEVLLVRRRGAHGAGTWSTPGGHLDFGESPEACARREALEEVGVAIGEVRFRAVTNDVMDSEGRHYVTLWMEGELLDGEPRPVAEHELSEVGWFRWDGLPQPLFRSFSNLMEGRCYPAESGGESVIFAS